MGPLSGLKIVEFAGIGGSPHCAMMLADLGADVVRLDRPGPSGLGVEVGTEYDLVLRSRRSVAVDLKADAGREVALRLIGQADALVESFRPGVMERMGLGPDTCLEINPKLVYGRLTGWGQSGPYAQMAGHDINYVALSGALGAIGPRDGPPVPPLNLVGDFGGGALHCAFGMVSALLCAARSGVGQVVDVAMVDGAAALMTMVVGFQRAGLWSKDRGDNIVDGGAPYYTVYETSDGLCVSIGAIEGKFYEALLDVLQMADDPGMRPHTDRALWPYQRERFAKAFLARTRQDWCDLLEGTDVCFAPVLSLEEAHRHPHIAERGTYIDAFGVNQPAPAPRFGVTQGKISRPPAEAGGASREVLLDWGFSGREIDHLCSLGVVVQKTP